MNLDGSEYELFIGCSKEGNVEEMVGEMVGEIDRTTNDENKDPVKLKLWRKRSTILVMRII